VDPLLLQRAVDEALTRGASYAEARFHSVKRAGVLVINGEPVSVTNTVTAGVAIRVVVKGGLGFAATTSVSMDGVRAAVSRAVAAARTSAAKMKRPVEMGPGRLGRARYSVASVKSFEDIPLDVKVGELVDLYRSVEKERDGFKVSNVVLSYTEVVEDKLIVNSDGAYVESSIPRIAVFYNIAATYEGRRANRWNTVGGSGGYELLERLNLRGEVEDDVRSLYLNLVKARSPPRGKMDVILGPEVIGLAVHESAGHPSEADRILGREAAQAGMSFRTTYGDEYIGSEHVTVVDDPTIPGSYGFYLYDDEGVAAGPRVIYEKGRLAGMLHNRETAAVFGTESNAAARAMDFNSEPIVRMANTYMKPGDYRFEELLEDVREGVYIKKYMEWNIDDVRWGQRYVGLEAYVVRNGDLAEPVRDVALEVTTRDLYSSIDAVGRDLRFFAGTCGKGEPPQGVPVWMGGPHVRLRGVKVG
jgi:TldD protein